MGIQCNAGFRVWVLCFIIVFQVSSTNAGEPQWWKNEKARCGLPPGLAFNSWNGKCGGGGGRPTVPIPVYDPLANAQAQFKKVLDHIVFVAPDLRYLSGLGTGSLAALTSTADRAFVMAAYRLDSTLQDNARTRQNLAQAAAAIAKLKARERKAQSALAVHAAGETRAALKELATEQGYVAAWERRVKNVAVLTHAFNRRSDAAAENVVQLLTVAVPPTAGLMAGNLLATRKKATVVPKPAQPIIANALVRRPTAADPRPIIRPRYRTAPAGSIEVKIRAIDQVAVVLGNALAEAEGLQVKTRRSNQALGEARRRATAAEAAERTKSAPLAAIRRQIAVARDSWTSAAGDGYRTGRNLIYAAVEAFILEEFRDRIVRPAVIRFVRDNGYTAPLEDSAIARMYQSGQALFSATRERYRSLGRMIDVAKQAREVVMDFTRYATATAEASAAPGNVQARSLLRENAALLDNQVWMFMEAATGGSDPLAQIGKRLLERGNRR